MTNWDEFAAEAPTIAEVFTRRHRATGALCFLGTTRADGSPRISPMEPQFFEGDLLIGGMPHTRKFEDLKRDPRICLHTATIDTQVSDGDAKVFGRVHHDPDTDRHQRNAEDVYARTGFDLRGQRFDDFLVVDLTGASSVAVAEQLEITIWRPGEGERVVRR